MQHGGATQEGALQGFDLDAFLAGEFGARGVLQLFLLARTLKVIKLNVIRKNTLVIAKSGLKIVTLRFACYFDPLKEIFGK